MLEFVSKVQSGLAEHGRIKIFGLRAVLRGRRIFLLGRVETYYDKQLANEVAIQAVAKARIRVVNSVRVVRAARQPACTSRD